MCVFCGKAATRLDLCHARSPVCDAHLGHQTAPLPKPDVKRPK